MSLASGVSDLATRIATYLKGSVLPRLLPSGGTANQVLTKSSATDYAASWTSPPQDVGFQVIEPPTANEVLGYFVATRRFTLVKDLVGSTAYADFPATADATFVFFKVTGTGAGATTTQIGAVVFPAGSYLGVFVAAATVTINPGDRVTMNAGPTPDATLRRFAVTLAGTR